MAWCRADPVVAEDVTETIPSSPVGINTRIEHGLGTGGMATNALADFGDTALVALLGFVQPDRERIIAEAWLTGGPHHPFRARRVTGPVLPCGPLTETGGRPRRNGPEHR